MLSVRHLVILALATLACGAASPTTTTSSDAADGAVDDTPHGCPMTHFRIGGVCIPGTDTECGPMRVACASGTSCALVSGGGELRPENVRCARD